TAIGASPSARYLHTAVSSESEMIVWGGVGDSGDLNTGGKYDPATNNWIATTLIDAPNARSEHTAVWTGTEMIVWGGFPIDTGGRYNPIMDSWTATNTLNAPSRRSGH